MNLCRKCTAYEDCSLEIKDRADICRYFVEDTGNPFPPRLQHVNERDMAEHYQKLKEEGFYATNAKSTEIRAKADKKVKKA